MEYNKRHKVTLKDNKALYIMEKYLTIKDLMDKLQVSRNFIYTLIDEGLQHYKIGKVVRFKETEVKEFIEKRKTIKN